MQTCSVFMNESNIGVHLPEDIRLLYDKSQNITFAHGAQYKPIGNESIHSENLLFRVISLSNLRPIDFGNLPAKMHCSQVMSRLLNLFSN